MQDEVDRGSNDAKPDDAAPTLAEGRRVPAAPFPTMQVQPRGYARGK